MMYRAFTLVTMIGTACICATAVYAVALYSYAR